MIKRNHTLMARLRKSQFTEADVLALADQITKARHLKRGSTVFSCPADARAKLRHLLRGEFQEVFCVAFLDNRHRLIEFRRMFYGTINGATVHPREIIRGVIDTNAASIVLAHNHPSGVSEPSNADRSITTRIQEAMKFMDVHLMDHLIIGDDEVVSFAERGWI